MEKTTLLFKLTRAEKVKIEILARAEGKSTSNYLRTKALNK